MRNSIIKKTNEVDCLLDDVVPISVLLLGTHDLPSTFLFPRRGILYRGTGFLDLYRERRFLAPAIRT